jgi:hypothetical protein
MLTHEPTSCKRAAVRMSELCLEYLLWRIRGHWSKSKSHLHAYLFAGHNGTLYQGIFRGSIPYCYEL